MRKVFKAHHLCIAGAFSVLGLLDAVLINSTLDARKSLAVENEAQPVTEKGLPTVSTERLVLEPPALSLTEELSRPLFAATRRPQQPPEAVSVEAVPEETPPVPFMWSVAGIVASKNGALVLLKRQDSALQEWHKLGDVVDGWTVATVDVNRVVVRFNSMPTILQLYPGGQ